MTDVTFGRVETGEDNGEVDVRDGGDKPLNVNEDGLGDGVWFAHYASHSRFAQHFELGCS